MIVRTFSPKRSIAKEVEHGNNVIVFPVKNVLVNKQTFVQILKEGYGFSVCIKLLPLVKYHIQEINNPGERFIYIKIDN